MIVYSKSDAGAVEIKQKEDYEGEFKTVNHQSPKGRCRTSNDSLPRAYRQKLQISDVKFRDLKKMCLDGIIPAEYHPYYLSLQPSAEVEDRLPEPDQDEDSEDEEEEE
ncbi:hypothetical protein GE061_006710 [Apolygus lucorum]|uniref:Uncharacterized protein n=1 Tax=Apolygus lucorum TaxID=248454 RepID=A0A8S9WUQ3_APOLU|nr:hypothetical protein GE061_006710 [Apolygus lucorum]